MIRLHTFKTLETRIIDRLRVARVVFHRCRAGQSSVDETEVFEN